MTSGVSAGRTWPAETPDVSARFPSGNPEGLALLGEPVWVENLCGNPLWRGWRFCPPTLDIPVPSLTFDILWLQISPPHFKIASFAYVYVSRPIPWYSRSASSLLLMMDRLGSYIWSFIWRYLLWPRVTWRGQIEVNHIFSGCILATLTDTVKLKGTPSIPETYLSSSVAWGLNLRVGWWRQILKKCKFSNGDL